MAFNRSRQTAVFLEERESRPLFAADLAGADTEVLQQDLAEQTAGIAHLKDAADSAETLGLPVLHPVFVNEDTSTDHENVSRGIEGRGELENTSQESNRPGNRLVCSTAGAPWSFTAGIARSLARSGSLLSGFLATIPLWKGFEPIAILSAPKEYRKGAGATDQAGGIGAFDLKAEKMFARRES